MTMYMEALHKLYVLIQTMIIFVFDKSYFNGESQNFVKRENCPMNSFISALCFSSILQENKF